MSCEGRLENRGALGESLNRRAMIRTSLGLAVSHPLLATGRAVGSSSLPMPHLEPKARHVIFCFMQGGMSHVDLFDPKPLLAKHDGEETFNDNLQSQGPGTRRWLKSPWKFRRHGESEIPISSLLPHLAECVDEGRFRDVQPS